MLFYFIYYNNYNNLYNIKFNNIHEIEKPFENDRAKLVSDPSVTPKIACDRVHAVLKRIISLIPSGPSFLITPIAEAFPDKFQDIKYQLWYLKNILKMIEYIPVLKEPILSLIVEKIIKIDVS